MAKKYRVRLIMNEGFYNFDAVIDRVFEAEDVDAATKIACNITEDFFDVMKQNKAKFSWVVLALETGKLEVNIPKNDKYKNVILKNFEIYDRSKGPFLPFPPTGELTMCNPKCIVSVTEDEFCAHLYYDACASIANSDYYRKHNHVTFECIAYGIEEVSC
ncbi:MAG: hypothetical protein RR365_13175 [Bacteroides sp.]